MNCLELTAIYLYPAIESIHHVCNILWDVSKIFLISVGYLVSRHQKNQNPTHINKLIKSFGPTQQHGIPAFGDWETTGNTPYTQKFEDVRRNKKTGVSSNPNDPRRNHEPPRKSPLHPSTYTPEASDQKPKYQPHARKPETDHPQPTGSPLHREPAPQRHANLQHQQHLHQGGYGSSHRGPYRPTAGAASPVQAANPARPKHRSAGMQTPERRASSEGHGPLTPGRSRGKQGGRDYEAEDEVAVPPFGDWDESNAASGEKYTGIFNRVRNNKLSPNSSVKQPPSSSGNQEHKVKQTCPCCIL